MARRSHSKFTLYWLLTLEVLLPKGWRGIVPMTSGSSRYSLDVPGTSTHTCCKQNGEITSWVWEQVSGERRGEERPEAHLQHVLHFDDATVQDGGTHWWDLDGSAVPRFPAFGTHDVAAQRAHHRTLLLHGAAGDEGLRLDDVGFGHHRSGGRVVKLCKHGYHLACGGRKRASAIADHEASKRSSSAGRRTHQGCSLCGRSLQSQTPVQSSCTTPVPSCPLFQPAVPDENNKMTFNIQKTNKSDIITMCESSAAHQQGRCVDVDGFNDRKLLLDLLDGGPRPVQLHFHPVPDAAVFPLEGGDQRLLWELEAEREFVSTRRKDRDLTVICGREDKNI